ncbi:hypothetical protein PHJA_000664200 [Phtheirospermum japonicum]|uniref:Uncharacterized protein n=1 Tax=Phtheirospermum japonicum TaxID=374723 RepID=A0A830BMV9_9LAMI|nr:hypothetical protein PHJA_000664200 [Phtheirospermum japonicum]
MTCNKKSRKLIKNKPPCLKECFLQPIILLAVFFTLLAVIACGLVLGGDSEFHSRAKSVTNVIINAAENASETIYSTTGAMKEIKSYLTRVDTNSKAIEFLTSTSKRLDSQASDIETQTYKNKGLIYDGLNLVLIVFCWIFTVLSWFFFGAYFFVKNFVEDTCMAIEGFQMDPYNNSFSSILPCDQLLSAKSVLTDVSAGIYELVNKVNWNISTSYGDIFRICNPFSPPPVYEYQPWDCPATSKQIGDVPRVLKELACPNSIGEACNGGILIPDNYYNTVEAYCSSIQTLLDVYPEMEYLIQCRTVKDAFSEIHNKHCKPLRKYLRMVWTSLLLLSLVLVVLIIVCIIGAHCEQNHKSSSGSVNTDQPSL